MRIQIPTTELKTAIVGLSKVVSPRASIPILACVRLDADGKAVTLTGTDLSQVATYEIKCDVPVTAPISALIPLESLQSLLKTTNGPAIEFEVGQDAVTLVGSVSGQNISRRVDMPDLKDWPSLPARATMKPADAQLLDHVRQAATFASTDDTRPLLKAVFLDVEGKSHKVVATDSRRLTALNSVRLPLSASVILPVTRFLTWGKLAGAPSIGADATSFTLNVGPWTYTTKVVEGRFPNYRQVIPTFGKDATTLELAVEDVELLVKALPGMPSFDNATDAVVLRLAPNAVRVCARENAKGPESVVRLEKSKCTGTAVSVGLDRRFLRDALIAGFLQWEVRDSTSPLVGHLSKDDVHSCHVLMPVRCVNVEAEPPSAAAAETQARVAAPVPVPVQPESIHKETTPMKRTEVTQSAQTESSPLDKIMAAFETAKTAVRQAQTALGDLAAHVRDAVREDKFRQREIADVRIALQKLQAIKV